MRRFVLLCWGLFLYMTAFAQLEVKEGSFKKVDGFVNINLDKQTDDNDRPYAVLKIRTENIDGKQRRELDFKGDARTFFEVEYKDGEVWLYISYYATYIKISHDDFSSTEFWFPFDMEPKCGYELTLVNKSLINEEVLKKLEEFEKANNQTGGAINTNNKTLYKEAFSVSPDKIVHFSKGNLQYQASTNTWRFAEHQWDVIGAMNRKISSNYSGWIDLFGWGTSGYNGKSPWMTHVRSKDYGNGEMDIAGTNYDWGVYNTISNGGDKRWRTLTADEWRYLLYTRSTSSGIRYAKAAVNGLNGVILLPDNWNSGIYELIETNTPNANRNIITQHDWQSFFEVNGAVFLPEAGHLGYNVDFQKNVGRYWSASAKGSRYAYCLSFDDSFAALPVIDRCFNCSVRLVCDVEEE